MYLDEGGYGGELEGKLEDVGLWGTVAYCRYEDFSKALG